MEITKYNIANWQVQFPSELEFSVDDGQDPPQFVFDTTEVTVYVTVWNWRNSKGESPDVNTVISFFEQGFLQQNKQPTDEYSGYYPEGFSTCAGKGITSDGYEIISFAVCANGSAVSLYFVFDKDAEKEKYLDFLRYVNLVDKKIGEEI